MIRHDATCVIIRSLLYISQECLKNEEKALEKSNEVKAGFEDIHKQMKEITSTVQNNIIIL